MNIYLIRHAATEEKTISGKDSDRMLTEKGNKDFTSSINHFNSLISNIETIISSPYKRAFQTAEIVRKELKLEKEIIKDNRLAPGSRIENLLEIINEVDSDNIAFIGHEPDFSQHISDLISNSGIKVNMGKGAIVKISFLNKPKLSQGIIEYLLPPLK